MPAIPSGFEDLAILIIMLLWTLPWKGVALWRASHRREKKWFIAMLVLNTLAALEILYIFVFSKKPIANNGPPPRRSGYGHSGARERGEVAPAKLAPPTKKEEAKARIMEAALNRGRITNNEAQILLGVSDATATNYFEELEQEGKIKQEGETGRGVFYTSK